MLDISNCTIGKVKPLYRIDALQLKPGRLTALIGANGAGKSTLLDAITSGHPIPGTISWKEKSLSALSSQERSLIIALVESRFEGGEYLSTLEYLQLGRYPYTGFSGRLSACDITVVTEIASRLKLDHLLEQSTLTLSDGERQRAGIARAMIQETPVILLDEPTSFLDYPNKRSTLQLLADLTRNENKVVLLACHDLELCIEYADDCLIINPNTRMLEHHATDTLTLEKLIALAFN